MAALINLSVGVLSAGCTLVQEAPILTLVFATPAAVALAVWRVKRCAGLRAQP